MAYMPRIFRLYNYYCDGTQLHKHNVVKFELRSVKFVCFRNANVNSAA
jgi:hypothetical protein